MPTPTWKGPVDALVEANNSPSYDLGDQAIKTRVYHGLFSFCETELADFGKGTVGTGDETGYAVQKASLRKVRGNIGQITVVWEAVGSGSGQPLPPDEVSVLPTNQSPRTERNPYYNDLDALTINGEAVKSIINAVVNGPDNERAMQQARIDNSALSAPQKALANNLIAKLQQGKEAYYMATLRYSWKTHSYTLPTTTRGGYIEAVGGPLDGYFVAGISWLREGDTLDYRQGAWQLTRSWLGADNWDTDLYA